MVTADYFYSLVKIHYAFLEAQYEFAVTEVTDEPRLIRVSYRKGEMLIDVRYSRTNYYVEVLICNYVSSVQYYWQHSISIPWLIKKDNTEYDFKDYDAIMPSVLSLDESVRQTSLLLNRYGTMILSGAEWYTWQEVAPVKEKKIGFKINMHGGPKWLDNKCWKIGAISLVIGILAFWLISQKINQVSLENHAYLTSGIVIKIKPATRSSGKSSGSPARIVYEYQYDGLKYEDQWYNYAGMDLRDTTHFIGKRFPVVLDSLHPYQSEMLFTENRYSAYGVQFPDSLR